ncbi:MAG: hypothetical protein V4641_08035 [Pseudomonadota bacterium]|jgi:hypothetical protein
MNDFFAIICKGQADADILRSLLPEYVALEARFLVSHNKSSGVSKARTVLLDPHSTVLVVEDSDTFNSGMIEERYDFILAALSLVSSAERFDAHIFVPEIEAIFFQDADFLALCGKPLNETELKAAQRAPKETLRELGLTADVIRQAGAQGAKLLRESPMIQELLARIRRLGVSQDSETVQGA